MLIYKRKYSYQTWVFHAGLHVPKSMRMYEIVIIKCPYCCAFRKKPYKSAFSHNLNVHAVLLDIMEQP